MIRLHELIEQANSSLSQDYRLQLAVQEVGETLRDSFERHRISCEVVTVGSADPRNFVATSDPYDPWGIFAPDCDMYVVTTFSQDPNKTRDAFSSVANGKFVVERGIPCYQFTAHGFHFDVGVVDEGSASDHVPLAFARRIPPLTQEHVVETRGLTLFMKRAGLYGGWHGGVKGNAVKELIRTHGTMKTALDYLHDSLRNSKAPSVSCPLTGRDLLSNLEPDILRRLHWNVGYAVETEGSGEPGFPDRYYALDLWDYQHSNQYRWSFRSPPLGDARALYLAARRFLMRTAEQHGEQLVFPSVFILPFSQGMGVYFATNDVDHQLTKDLEPPVGRKLTSFVETFI